MTFKNRYYGLAFKNTMSCFGIWCSTLLFGWNGKVKQKQNFVPRTTKLYESVIKNTSKVTFEIGWTQYDHSENYSRKWKRKKKIPLPTSNINSFKVLQHTCMAAWLECALQTFLPKKDKKDFQLLIKNL